MRHGVEREVRVQDRLDEAGPHVDVEPQPPGQRALSEIGIDQQHTGIGGLGQGAREIDRGRGLAVRHARARDRHDHEIGRFVELLDPVPERPVLLGLERGRREHAHEMLVELARERWR